MKKENILIGTLGLATLATIIIEVATVSDKTTRIESSLFGILQFLLSLGFAWYLSKSNSQEEFEKQQRKFAISAFRRIKEVESQINRLIYRIESSMSGSSDNYLHGLDMAKALAQSVNETTQSSKLDWADVIGDQIETLEKIENIQGDTICNNQDQATDSESKNQININELKKSLSTELKLFSNEKRGLSTRNILTTELKEKGYLILHGFVDKDFSPSRDSKKLQIGEELTVKLTDEGNRIASLAAYGKDGTYIGSFLNRYPDTYSEFTRHVCKTLGASTFSAEIISIDKRQSATGRLKFKVKAMPKNS